MIEGVTISLGGQDFVVPPLSLGAYFRLRDAGDFDRAAGVGDANGNGFSLTRMQANCRVIHAALARNYPDITVEQLEELIDLGNLAKTSAAVMGQSGFEFRKGGAPPGEAQGSSSAMSSIRPSSPRPDGRGNISTNS